MATSNIEHVGHSRDRGRPEHHSSPHGQLLIGCVGVVYGDIGTSPLYAFREAVTHARSPEFPTPGSPRGAIAHILDAGPHRLPEVRVGAAARRQQRRRRRLCIDVVGSICELTQYANTIGARHCRRLVLLRRCCADPSNLSSVGSGGTEAHRTAVRVVRRSGHDSHSHRSFLGSVPWELSGLQKSSAR